MRNAGSLECWQRLDSKPIPQNVADIITFGASVPVCQGAQSRGLPISIRLDTIATSTNSRQRSIDHDRGKGLSGQ